MNSWVLSPCQRSRLTLLKRMLDSLEHPSDRVVIVATQPDPITADDLIGYAQHIVLCDFTEHHIAKWWNAGLDYIMARAAFHEVLVLSSDHVGTTYSVAMLGTFLRKNDLTMVGPNPWCGSERIFRLGDQRATQSRVPGNCWMLAGESGLRVDENFRWWYSDDDIEMQARQYGGTGIVPGTGLVADADTPLNEEKQRWAAEDRQRFVTKWGIQPW
jgi:hypothetical protein